MRFTLSERQLLLAPQVEMAAMAEMLEMVGTAVRLAREA